MPLSSLARHASALTLLAAPFAVQAQKRPITQADWDRWESIASPTLSPDGKWAAYTLNPRVGDGTFIVRSTTGSTEYRVDLGYTNRENNTPGALRPTSGGGGGGGRGGRAGRRTGTGPFSADGKFAFVVVSQAPKAQVDSAEAAQPAGGRGGRGGRGSGGAAALARAAQSLRVIRLSDGNIESIQRASAFRVPTPTAGGSRTRCATRRRPIPPAGGAGAAAQRPAAAEAAARTAHAARMAATSWFATSRTGRR